MDKIEFIEKVSEMGLVVVDERFEIVILNKNDFLLATISNLYKYQFRFYHVGISYLKDDYKAKFINLVVEYVRSPIERKQDKKYCLRHRYMIDSYGTGFNHLGVDRQTHSVSFLDSKHDGYNIQTAFTLDEIEELKKNFNTDFSDFEIEEYGGKYKWRPRILELNYQKMVFL